MSDLIIIDGNHADNFVSFHDLAAAGVKGVIHKATDGLHWVDDAYLSRMKRAQSIPFLWASYHFIQNADGSQQAQHFLNNCDRTSLLACDWELPTDAKGNPLPPATLAQVLAFVNTIHNITGRWPVLYSGEAFLNEQNKVHHLANTLLNNCPLWIAEYSRAPQVFKPVALHQFTDSYEVAGMGNKCDASRFWTDDEQALRSFWGQH